MNSFEIIHALEKELATLRSKLESCLENARVYREMEKDLSEKIIAVERTIKYIKGGE